MRNPVLLQCSIAYGYREIMFLGSKKMLNVDATCRITSHAHENVAAPVTLSWVKPAPNWLKCNVD